MWPAGIEGNRRGSNRTHASLCLSKRIAATRTDSDRIEGGRMGIEANIILATGIGGTATGSNRNESDRSEEFIIEPSGNTSHSERSEPKRP